MPRRRCGGARADGPAAGVERTQTCARRHGGVASDNAGRMNASTIAVCHSMKAAMTAA